MKQRIPRRFRTISALKDEFTQSGYLKELHALGTASKTCRVWYTTNLFSIIFDSSDVDRKKIFEKIVLDNVLIYYTKELTTSRNISIINDRKLRLLLTNDF